jgi:hypothetical protein
VSYPGDPQLLQLLSEQQGEGGREGGREGGVIIIQPLFKQRKLHSSQDRECGPNNEFTVHGPGNYVDL